MRFQCAYISLVKIPFLSSCSAIIKGKILSGGSADAQIPKLQAHSTRKLFRIGDKPPALVTVFKALAVV
jgi:hypothetical protein